MRVFKDIELQKKFDANGFVKVSLVNKDILAELSALYKEVQPVSYEGFSSTIYNPDIDLKKSTSNNIFNKLNASVEAQLTGFRPLGCSFLCKTPGPKSFLPVHQDWTIVDESKYDSITIWIPLIDVTASNGAMKVLPGSHKFSPVLRSPTLPGVFQQLNSEIFDSMDLLEVKAGEAVIFSQALLHASLPNLSEQDRIVATFGLVPSEAPLHFYHRNNEGLTEKYEIEDDFFITYNEIGSAPKFGKKIETFEYKWQNWSATDLKVANERAKHNKMHMNMKRLFKDDQIQEFYSKNGFAKFPILGEEEVKALLNLYKEEGLTDQYGTGFSMSMEENDKEKVARIRDKIYEIALPKALQHFDDAKVIAGSYVVKHKNPRGIVPPHQDWTFADNEGEYSSVTCWITLVDTTRENGYMGVVKGSHTMLNNLRPSPSPQIPTPLMNHMFQLFPYMEMYEMKAGEALIFDHRTFHGSTPNITDDPRIAIGLGFTQKDATICHYTLKMNDKKDTLLKYYVDDDFLLKYDNALLSRMYDKNETIQGYEIAEELPFDLKQPTLEELVAMATQNGNVFNEDMVTYLSGLFGEYMNKQEEPTEQEAPEATYAAPAEPEQQVWKDNRTFLQMYTPLNIIRELKNRLVGK